jgi:hypothetical protein
MPWVGFELTITASERAKTVHVLDRSATVTGPHVFIFRIKFFYTWKSYCRTTEVHDFKMTFKCHLRHVMMHVVVEKHEKQVTSIFCLKYKHHWAKWKSRGRSVYSLVKARNEIYSDARMKQDMLIAGIRGTHEDNMNSLRRRSSRISWISISVKNGHSKQNFGTTNQIATNIKDISKRRREFQRIKHIRNIYTYINKTFFGVLWNFGITR